MAQLDNLIIQFGLQPEQISQQQLQQLCSQCPAPQQSAHADVCEALRAFDRDENGLIAESELRTVLTQLGETLGHDEANDLMRLIKVDSQTGKVRIDEFVRTILNC